VEGQTKIVMFRELGRNENGSALEMSLDWLLVNFGSPGPVLRSRFLVLFRARVEVRRSPRKCRNSNTFALNEHTMLEVVYRGSGDSITLLGELKISRSQ